MPRFTMVRRQKALKGLKLTPVLRPLCRDSWARRLRILETNLAAADGRVLQPQPQPNDVLLRGFECGRELRVAEVGGPGPRGFANLQPGGSDHGGGHSCA